MEFVCSVCEKTFSVNEEVLKKYPNWVPKYCREHSPKKKKDGVKTEIKSGAELSSQGSRRGITIEQDLTIAEVLSNFSEGPDTGIFTDGSSRPNPGPGGWGAVLVRAGKVIDYKYGSEKETTNNRMELTGLIAGYKMLGSDETIDIYTDSELCVNTITKWAPSWEKNGWKRKTGPIKNLELIQELYALHKEKPHVNIKWIKAHNGWLWNEYADSLSTAWARDTL